MANVPLRAYIREIETIIDRGNTDEAIAHCRHILATFPKHLDTYRMLGKANLESRRYGEAADIFTRILLATPDDFVSHVGMSIIQDDQKKLDETIWHMERAFEVQPSNAAVQAELQRLYGKRDGREPHKIRLTRGALAHMYVQGELHAQAIGEIRSVLAEDPGRTDMLALLAVAYYRNGQKADASETCTQLLNKSPYCLVANQILVEILPGTGMADTIPAYRNRVFELDPYAAHAPGSIFQIEEAPENAVMIQRLEYAGQPVGEQADWRGSLGTDTAEPPPPQASWMQFSNEEPVSPPSAPEAAAPGQAEAIPDWMRDHGWGESSGTFDEAAFSNADAPVGSELEKANLPDWIKSMAPDEDAAANPPATAEPASSQGDSMDWLNDLGAASSSSEPRQESSDWLSNLSQPTEQPPALEPVAPAAPASSLGDLGTSVADQDAALLWLESLAAKQGAQAEELITDPSARLEKPPEWVEQARAIGESQEAAPPQPAQEPAWPAADDTGIFDNPPRSSAMDETSIWLKKLDEEEASPASVGEEAAAAPTPSSGAWFEDAGAGIASLQESAELSEGWGTEAAPAAHAPEPARESADVPAWLQDLERDRESTPPISSVTAAAASDLPSWLLDQPQAEPEPQPVIPEPTRPTEWVPEASPVQKTPHTESARPSKPAEPKPAPKPKEPRRKAPVDERVKAGRGGILPPMTDAGLDQARDLLMHGKIPDALQAYGALIRKGKMLDEITFDLKEALYRFPVEVSIWQALGDAYMRANRLQDALDAYTKAEELLR